MEITFNAGDSGWIPEGCTAKIENGMVVIDEKIPELKKGDFVNILDDIHIISYVRLDLVYYDVFYNRITSTLILGKEWAKLSFCEIATPAEREFLIDKLHDAGKDWDADKMEIVDLVWIPKRGDKIWYPDSFGSAENIVLNEDNYDPVYCDFRTKELAEAAIEVLKTLKHF